MCSGLGSFAIVAAMAMSGWCGPGLMRSNRPWAPGVVVMVVSGVRITIAVMVVGSRFVMVCRSRSVSVDVMVCSLIEPLGVIW
ncbi:hypothetical protein NRB20_75480 [Nocardia sp. RB20]|uniref:Uncharacterized protein n=1 Tax=Nocardia macrotermitis TaxID=2585198 RepID=A0A7K0DF35_9NOCA|nr:hypothetical protein [Nocardia macrotermitis]